MKSAYFEKHKAFIEEAVKALHQRSFWAAFPESPKAYAEGGDAAAKSWIGQQMTQDFKELSQEGDSWIGEEFSPFLQLGIGVRYPTLPVEKYLSNATHDWNDWKKLSVSQRAGILTECLMQLRSRFFDIAYATMHTTGQAYMMSFQASGPHACDRAMESIALGYEQLNMVPEFVTWTKPMGKFDLVLEKDFHAIPRGISLVIGCSTFPVWNTLPGVFASLITGNTVIIKPHPKAILPIAIVVAEMQKVFLAVGLPPFLLQLAVDTEQQPITKQLCESAEVKMIDFTGSNHFGQYVESLPNKVVFTEKAGVNCAIIDSVKDVKSVAGNLAFSCSLYSGQMCTAPQNIFIPQNGINTPDGMVSADEMEAAIVQAFHDLAQNPKMGPHVLGAIQSEQTLQRLKSAGDSGGISLDEPKQVTNEEFPDSRTFSPALIGLKADDNQIFNEECFGPIVYIIRTENTQESIDIVKKLSGLKGALTCLAYVTDNQIQAEIQEKMNAAFTPVSFNFSGAAFVNQHAAFSDFHVTGGNPAGNASFTDPNYINRRFVWVGNRKLN